MGSFRSVPGSRLAPGNDRALLLLGQDGKGEPDVGNDKVDDVVGEAADEVALAERPGDGLEQVGKYVHALVAVDLNVAVGFAVWIFGKLSINDTFKSKVLF